jgi:hypothetical protein
MGAVSGSVAMTATFSDYVTAGQISPQTLTQAIGAAGTPQAKVTYANGTGAGLCDLAYALPVALVASTPQTFDLTSGLTGIGGEALNFARVREFIVYNPDTTAGHDVGVYHGASNGWAALPASGNPLYARAGGGSIRISDPQSTGGGNGNVTGGASKTFTVDPGSNNVTVYVLIAGGSVA